MSDAKFFLVVRFWIAPEAEAQVMRWLDGGHVAEVLKQPGCLWCRRLKPDDGGYAMIYGIESRAAFEAYEANTALKAKFRKRARAVREAHAHRALRREVERSL